MRDNARREPLAKRSAYLIGMLLARAAATANGQPLRHTETVYSDRPIVACIRSGTVGLHDRYRALEKLAVELQKRLESAAPISGRNAALKRKGVQLRPNASASGHPFTML